MATREPRKTEKKNMVSTKKIYKINPSRLIKLQNNSCLHGAKTTPDFDLPTRPTTSDTQNGFINPHQTQNFSSRNSLRTATTLSAHQHQTIAPFTMPDIAKLTHNYGSLKRTVDDTSKYKLLATENFVILEDNFLYCMLCGKRQPAAENEDSEEYSAVNHILSEFHERRYSDLKHKLFQQVPNNSCLNMHALRELLNTWYTRQSPTNDVIKSRISVMYDFEAILNMVMPECYYRVIGSMMTGTPLISSDINLELIHPNSHLFETKQCTKNSIHHKLIEPDAELGNQINHHSVHYDLISNAIDTLYKIMNAVNNRYPGSPTNSFRVISKLNDLNAIVPKLVLQHAYSKTVVQVCCYAESRHKLDVLLKTYMSFDSRATILSVLVKYWAKICKIDNPENGTYPSYVFVILVIYFLQRTSPPILPCLHELIKAETRNDRSESVPIDRFKKLDIAEEKYKRTTDSLILERQQPNDLESPPMATEVITEEDVDEEEEDDDYLNAESDIIKKLKWISTNDTPVHRLFLDFLLFMFYEFNETQTVISIRSLSKVHTETKGYYVTQVKAIEHPVRPRVNISRCIGTTRTFTYVKNCFKQSFRYLTCLPVDTSIKPRQGPDFDYNYENNIFMHANRFYSYFKMRKDSIRIRCKYQPIDEMIRQNLFAKDVDVINVLIDKAFKESNSIDKLPAAVANFYDEKWMVPKDYEKAIFCGLCKGNSHTKQTCFRGKIENLTREYETYDLDLDYEADLDSYFIRIFEKDTITPQLSKTHQVVVDQLEKMINSALKLRCRLQLFGSTVNNLGSYDSDLDICMTLYGNPTGKGVDCVNILEKVHSVLVKEERISSIEAILTARVPIIKFKYMDFDVDLSMYNQCAIYNSKLLKAYASIDVRVPQLFYLVKRYAKACKIADASRGSLSSYAWSLLVIHYLQQTQPPILPVLQEVPNGSQKPLIGINGWNVWFNDRYTCPQEPDNKMTLTQLLKGFFLYYSSFDFNIFIVSIRKVQKITRFQKSWNNCAMSIEDPFELTYNLASRLDESMAIYIINSFAFAFRNILEIQSTYRQLKHQNRDINFSSKLDRVFNYRYITNSNPPYRGCRVCHRIGHRFKDCPEKNAKRNQR